MAIILQTVITICYDLPCRHCAMILSDNNNNNYNNNKTPLSPSDVTTDVCKNLNAEMRNLHCLSLLSTYFQLTISQKPYVHQSSV